MRWRFLFLPLIMLLAIQPSAAAADPDPAGSEALAKVAQRIASQNVVRATFAQERHARAFTSPLTSAGRIVIAPDAGLLWLLEDPFTVTIALTLERVIEREEGMALRVTPIATQPVFRALMGLFLDLPSGRADALAATFTPELDSRAGGWRLRLIPRDALLAKAIAVIEVTGGSFINTVVVNEASGDFTIVRFADHAVDADGLSEQETQAFLE
jgi:hypothetical protein